MTLDELKNVLDAHAKWRRGEMVGKRADLAGADLTRANLARANLAGADLTGAYLAGADLAGADLTRANLAGANLTDAYLTGAYLTGADLAGANLARADLTGADLAGANLGNDRKAAGLITRVTRVIDPYEFFAWRTDKGDFIKAGCRFLSVEEFRAHVQKEYPGTQKAAETLAILDFIDLRFKATEEKQ